MDLRFIDFAEIIEIIVSWLSGERIFTDQPDVEQL